MNDDERSEAVKRYTSTDRLKDHILSMLDYISKQDIYIIKISEDEESFTIIYDNCFTKQEPQTLEVSSRDAYQWCQAVLGGFIVCRYSPLKRSIEHSLENLKSFQNHKSKAKPQYISLSISYLNDALKAMEEIQEMEDELSHKKFFDEERERHS